VVRLLERGNMSAILSFGSEADLVKILQHPTTSIACDCGASTETRQHPRAFGTFPRVLGRYVREQHVLTWEDAIRKMTALPAATIGMVDRGFLAPGMSADVTVFDPATVIDHATYDDAGQLSEGIRFVLVNGRVALRDGKVTGEQAGRVLNRDRHMPTRPMTSGDRRLAMKDPRVTIDLTQRATAPHAGGTLRFKDPGTGDTYEASELGMVQTTTNWASVTAIVVNRATGAMHAATVVLDDDRAAGGRPRTVHIYLDDGSKMYE